MSKCPICSSAEAVVTGAKRIPGAERAPWTVNCPVCRIPFEIDGKDVNLSVTNPREFAGRQRRWKQILEDAIQRGEARARLY
jgi:hypothetical protein